MCLRAPIWAEHLKLTSRCLRGDPITNPICWAYCVEVGGVLWSTSTHIPLLSTEPIVDIGRVLWNTSTIPLLEIIHHTEMVLIRTTYYYHKHSLVCIYYLWFKKIPSHNFLYIHLIKNLLLYSLLNNDQIWLNQSKWWWSLSRLWYNLWISVKCCNTILF